MQATRQYSRLKITLFLLLMFSMVAPKAAMAGSPGEEKGLPDFSRAGPTPLTTFAAYGDIPYIIKLPNGRTDEEVLNEEIAPTLRRRDDISFIIHLGDLSRPEYACTDEWLRQTSTFWKQKLVKPVFYTPGDNDWADCDRKNLAVRQSEYERLQHLRDILFGSPKTVSPTWQLEETQRILNRDPQLAHPEKSLEAIRKVLAMDPAQFAKEWRYESQPQQPENAIWWRDGVLFVTVHKISTDDGRSEIFLDDPSKAIALVEERDRRNQQWLNRAFNLAKGEEIKALVVATQLDPFGPAPKSRTALAQCLSNPAYAGFCRQIQGLSRSLAKPVLLLHGDTNGYCLDKPFGNSLNLWRLNAPGDFKYVDAAVIKVFPADPTQPFHVTGLLSGVTPPAVCDYRL
jgi:hypothetical protein